MSIIPTLLDTYPEITKEEVLKKNYIIIDYGKYFPATPIFIEFCLVSNNFNYQSEIIDKKIKSGIVIRDFLILKESKLKLYILIQPSKKISIFPPHHIQGTFKHKIP